MVSGVSEGTCWTGELTSCQSSGEFLKKAAVSTAREEHWRAKEQSRAFSSSNLRTVGQAQATPAAVPHGAFLPGPLVSQPAALALKPPASEMPSFKGLNQDNRAGWQVDFILGSTCVAWWRLLDSRCQLDVPFQAGEKRGGEICRPC